MSEATLSENAISIFKNLYSKNGETVNDTFRRAAKYVSKNQDEEDLAFQLQQDNIIRFNTPLYFNSGGKTNLFSACWVVPLKDSMDGIYDVSNVARKIFSYGSGIGIPIGNLREKDAPIFDGDTETAPCGKSSGPIVFMKLYDAVAATTKSGGRARRAAILCAMQVWHPDILDFIHAKEIDGTLSNMNLSVTITDKFMDCVKDNIPFSLHTPYDGSLIRNEDPNLIWDSICKQAHKSGDPGVIFIDTVNRFNPLINELLIETPNPCLIGDTIVETDKGPVSIKELISKDFQSYKILSASASAFELDDILDVKFTKSSANVIKIEVEDEGIIYTLVCTPEHKIYTHNRGYIEAENLSFEDNICIFIK